MTQDDQGPLALLSDMKPNPIGLHITKGNSLIVRRAPGAQPMTLRNNRSVSGNRADMNGVRNLSFMGIVG